MFEKPIDYPCAIADQTEEGAVAAFNWVIEHKKDDEELSLWVPLKSTLRNNDFLVDLARHEGKGLRIFAKDPIYRVDGPILAMYPGVADLSYVTAAKGITALAVVQWADKLDIWAREVNAEVVHTFEPEHDRPPSLVGGSEPELTPEVIAGLAEITKLINHDNTIAASGFEKDVTIKTLLKFHDAGHALPAKRMAEWAVAHGWRRDNPKELINWVRKINSGTRPRTSRY